MKSAFITGANRGLGYGLVEYLLSEGYQVFAGTRNIADMLPKKEHLIWIECDVLDDDSIAKAINTISAQTESLTLLINNAGVNKDTIPEGDKDLVSKLGKLDRNALLNMFNINTISPLIITQKFIPLLKTNPCYVINISSARASFKGGHSQASTSNYGYAATKVALNMFTARSTGELPDNVRTFAVNPGSIKTDMNPDGANEPLAKAEKIINITKNWKDEFNGGFVHHDGELHEI